MRIAWFAALGFIGFTASACIPDVIPDLHSLPRCEGVEPRCGPGKNESCCADTPIDGGEFKRRDVAPALVSDFRLDRFEVTVGRFRRFVASYPKVKPTEGAGAQPNIEGSGWTSAWDAKLPADQAALRESLKCDPVFQTWTDEPSLTDERPINCVTWYLAFAFCAWDGGYLPTEAQWSYAAAAGSEERNFPWGNWSPGPDEAVWGCDTTETLCLLPAVGSRSPKGDGYWGHADLAGSVGEWLLDFHGTLPVPCSDCANLQDEGFGRVTRGGDYAHGDYLLDNDNDMDIGHFPETRESFLGVRCARSPSSS
jgi:sulfatase modifying factor 1